MESTPNAPAAPAASAPAQETVTSPAIGGDQASPPAPDAGAAAETPEPPKPSRLQARIDELTRQRYDEQRRADAAQAQLEQFQRHQALSQQFSQLDAQAPDINRFQSLHEYQMAMADWTTRRAAAVATAHWERMTQEQQNRQAQVQAQALAQQHQAFQENAAIESKMAAGVKKYPDFQKVLTNPDLPSTRGTPLFSAVMASENAVDIAYSLAKNPAELDRLLSIRDPMHLAREVFRLDAKFAGNGVTSAPPPPPNRMGSSHAPKDWSQMGTAEHVRAYREAKSKRG